MKRIFVTTIAASALLMGGVALAQNFQAATPAQSVQGFSHPDTVAADLDMLDMALNNTGTLRGRFVQTAGDGRTAQGNIYLSRPGKIRFEYDAPNPMLIVSDGKTIMQSDKALGTSDRIPLKSTPLDFFLKNQVKLSRDTQVLSLIKRPGETQVTVRDGSGKAAGEMTLIFDAGNYALKEWIVLDEFGTSTRITLSGLVYNESLDPQLFVLDRGAKRRRD
ncbi:MAG: outer membrane lipoprotein carrier protein LolA [Robiginitomaculum sp.]